MHGKNLILEVFKGNPVERTPWVPYTGSQIANLKGYTAQEMFRDAGKLYECCIEAESQYSPDGMTPMFDLQVEAEILGCDLAWYDNTPPTVCSHPLEGELVIPTRRIQKTDGRIPLILDVMRRFKAAKPDIAMYGLVCGPFTLASHLRGTNIFMDMYDDEDGVKALVAYCEEVVREVAEYYIEAGCDIIAAVDPLVSQISPDMFETFLSGPYTKFFASMREKGMPSSFFVCGDATKNIEPMCLTKPDCIAIDENVDIVEAKKLTDAHGITTPKFKQLKMETEAAENLSFEPHFPEIKLLLFPEKCVLILLWCFKIQSGMWAFLIIESNVFVNLLSQFSLGAVSTAVKLFLLEHGKERFHYGVVMGCSRTGKRLRDL